MDRLRRLLMAGAAVVTAFAATLVVADPAHAETGYACYPQTKKIKRPGTTIENRIEIEMCVQRDANNNLNAWAVMRGNGHSGGATDIVYNATLNVRLERYDTVLLSEACSVAWIINSPDPTSYVCKTANKNTTAKGGWSGDGILYYDVINDGKGTQSWDLHGSDLIN